ncbi:MAG: hypothetical protein Q4G34_06085 [Micrococcus sp.]|nr:hypothetical protein [Micrococcus sp.]
MEYVIPLLAVVVIGAVVVGVVTWMGKRTPKEGSAAAGAEAGPAGITAERAQFASGLLSEEAHREVYGGIATNRVMEAIRVYRRRTGRSLREAVTDVQALAMFPQVYTLPQEPEQDEAAAATAVETQPGRGSAGQSSAGRADAAAGADRASGADRARPSEERAQAGERSTEGERGQDGAAGEVSPWDEDDQTAAEDSPMAATVSGEASDEDARVNDARVRDADAAAPVQQSGDGVEPARGEADPVVPDSPADLVIPSDWTAEPAAEDRPFEVEVMRGERTVHLSSRDLSPWLRDQLAAMLRDGNLETAAVQLSSHTELSVPEAFELLRRIRESGEA